MSREDQVFRLRQRIATLEGQRSQADAELTILKKVDCPACQGRGYFEETREDTIYTTDCHLCNTTGKARGKEPY